MTHPLPTSSARAGSLSGALRTPAFHGLLGFAVGLVDLGLLAWLDVRMRYADHDVRVPVVLLFAGTFALLGYAVGHLREARVRAVADQETIRRQLIALRAEQARALENEALASVGRLSASVAHEVRNPLGVIRASASVLQEELRDGDADVVQACVFIREEVERLDGFVAKLLGYARPSAFATTVQDPAALLERVVALTEGPPAQLTLDVSVAHAAIDAELLLPALVNVVQNARQAAASSVRVAARVEDRALVVEVRDDGAGVAPAHQARLFEPFFTTKSTGTGLGLAMARKLVTAHRGMLGYVADAGLGEGGRGGCFRIILPDAEAA
ncbi:MAG: ATP-binding protein [Myxococcales bacterium]|nr:ATP-binding protein [Myxococcales bacterium]